MAIKLWRKLRQIQKNHKRLCQVLVKMGRRWYNGIVGARRLLCIPQRSGHAESAGGEAQPPGAENRQEKDHGGEWIMDMTGMKHEIEALAEAHREEFEAVSACIFEHPELAFQEKTAQNELCSLLERHGFSVKRGAGSLDTAFVAEYNSGKPGMTFAFLCEYDALPELGHACGHNLIGTSGAGAGVVLKEIMEKYGIGGTLKVFGTPAEENGSGKITMLDEGIFEGVDMSLIMHPSDLSMADDISFAAVNKVYTFKGKPAHTAACPWVGASALNGVMQMFHAVDSQRLHFKDYTRVHGIVLEGGTAVNIVPERAVCKFNIRALDSEYLKEVIAVIDRCAQGAAMCAGVEVEISQDGYLIEDVRNDQRLVEAVEKNMDLIGEHHIPRDLTQGIGSTDVGNVTHAMPAAQFYIGVGEGLGTHTAPFAEASGGPAGKRALLAAVKVLAMTGLDMMAE